MMKHRPVLYAFEEPSNNRTNSSKPHYHHVAGVNDLAPSFRSSINNNDNNDNFHFLSAGRDGKLLEWRMPSSTITKKSKKSLEDDDENNNNSSHNNESEGAVSCFKPHADWVNCVLPIPDVGFVTGGADNILRITTVCPLSSPEEQDDDDNNKRNTKITKKIETNNNNNIVTEYTT